MMHLLGETLCGCFLLMYPTQDLFDNIFINRDIIYTPAWDTSAGYFIVIYSSFKRN